MKLTCSGCGAYALGACSCGVEYIPAAGQRAAKAVKADPQNRKSNRAIAADIGVDEGTIRKARKSTAENSAVEKRTGKDGRTRRMPSRKAAKEDTCDDACDYDWSNPKPADFGDDVSRMYHAQAIHYRTEAGHLATAYPLLAPGVDPSIITQFEINEARKVADAWLVTVKKLKVLQQKKGR